MLDAHESDANLILWPAIILTHRCEISKEKENKQTYPTAQAGEAEARETSLR